MMNLDIMKSITKLPKLSSLQYMITKEWKEYLPLTIDLCARSETLTHLSLLSPTYGRYDAVSFAALADLGKAMSNLRSVELSGLWQGCDQILAHMNCPNLAHIKIFQSFFSQHLDEQLISFFSRHRNSLRSVSIQGNWRGCYTDWSNELLEHLGGIHDLSFTSTDMLINTNSLLVSKRCKLLKSLEVRTYQVGEMEGDTLQKLFERCQELKNIIIRPLASISNRLTEYRRSTRKFEMFTLQ